MNADYWKYCCLGQPVRHRALSTKSRECVLHWGVDKANNIDYHSNIIITVFLLHFIFETTHPCSLYKHTVWIMIAWCKQRRTRPYRIHLGHSSICKPFLYILKVMTLNLTSVSLIFVFHTRPKHPSMAPLEVVVGVNLLLRPWTSLAKTSVLASQVLAHSLARRPCISSKYLPMQLMVCAPDRLKAIQVICVDAVSMASLFAASKLYGSSLAALRTCKITKGASK